jgi:hypothetical protein
MENMLHPSNLDLVVNKAQENMSMTNILDWKNLNLTVRKRESDKYVRPK